jgi:intraflagellar transport protein 172
MAFVCWNRFLDLTEAIDENDASGLMENIDFQNTDVPFNINLSAQNVDV